MDRPYTSIGRLLAMSNSDRCPPHWPEWLREAAEQLMRNETAKSELIAACEAILESDADQLGKQSAGILRGSIEKAKGN